MEQMGFLGLIEHRARSSDLAERWLMSAIHQVIETQSQASGLVIESAQRQLELPKHLLKIWSN